MGKVSLFLFTLLSLGVAAKPAHALTLGDAALTVAISTGAGAALGASTLPFYSDSGAHTKNVFTGAAIGAVVGVIACAAAGISEPETGDDARLHSTKPAEDLLAQRLRLSPDAILTTNVKKREETLFWSPLAKVSF